MLLFYFKLCNFLLTNVAIKLSGFTDDIYVARPVTGKDLQATFCRQTFLNPEEMADSYVDQPRKEHRRQLHRPSCTTADTTIKNESSTMLGLRRKIVTAGRKLRTAILEYAVEKKNPVDA